MCWHQLAGCWLELPPRFTWPLHNVHTPHLSGTRSSLKQARGVLVTAADMAKEQYTNPCPWEDSGQARTRLGSRATPFFVEPAERAEERHLVDTEEGHVRHHTLSLGR